MLLSNKIDNLTIDYPLEFLREWRGCSDMDCLPGCCIKDRHCERIAQAYREWRAKDQPS